MPTQGLLRSGMLEWMYEMIRVHTCPAVGCRSGPCRMCSQAGRQVLVLVVGEGGTWALMKSTGEVENARKKERRRAASRPRATSAATLWSICRAVDRHGHASDADRWSNIGRISRPCSGVNCIQALHKKLWTPMHVRYCGHYRKQDARASQDSAQHEVDVRLRHATSAMSGQRNRVEVAVAANTVQQAANAVVARLPRDVHIDVIALWQRLGQTAHPVDPNRSPFMRAARIAAHLCWWTGASSGRRTLP